MADWNPCKNYSGVSAASNNAAVIKIGPNVEFHGMYVYNTNAAVRYIKFYDKATAPAPNTDNALLVGRFAIPPGGGGAFIDGVGIQFSTTANGNGSLVNGLAVAMVTGSSDTDNTAVGAGDLIFNILWK